MNYTDVLEFRIIGDIYDVTKELNVWLKATWKEDRKVYNATKELHKQIKDNSETSSYYMMSGNELTVNRGLILLEETKYTAKHIKDDVAIVNKSKKTTELIEKMESIIEKIELIMVTINMIEHNESIYNKL